MKQHGVRPEIEVFDLSIIHGARLLVDRGIIDHRPHVQFVLGVKNALPAQEHLLDVLLAENCGASCLKRHGPPPASADINRK